MINRSKGYRLSSQIGTACALVMSNCENSQQEGTAQMSYEDYARGPAGRGERARARYGAGAAFEQASVRARCRRVLRKADEILTPTGMRPWMIFVAGLIVGLILG